jgi:hypothetical protein
MGLPVFLKSMRASRTSFRQAYPVPKSEGSKEPRRKIPLIRSSFAAFLKETRRRCRGTLFVLSLLRALVSGSVEEACSGESVMFIDMSKTRIDPRSIVTRCSPLDPAEIDATTRIKKRSSGPPNTNIKAARLAKKVMKNCFIEAKRTGVSSA